MTEDAIIMVGLFAMIALCFWASAWRDRGPRVITRKCDCKCSIRPAPTTEKRL